MEEVGTEEEKHVPMSLHINCLGWVVLQGNAAEGSKEEKASPVTASWGLCTPVAKGVMDEAESLKGFHRSQGIPWKPDYRAILH